MADEKIVLTKAQIPKDGMTVSLPDGKALTRIHLDIGKDGITLATVGAASALKAGHRQHIALKPAKDGITLAMVGAASAPK